MFDRLTSFARRIVRRSRQRSTEQRVGSVLLKREAFAAQVIRACKKCGAPGRYLSAPSVQTAWPGCYVAATDERHEKSVGPKCPNCGAQRPANENLGELWSREVWADNVRTIEKR